MFKIMLVFLVAVGLQLASVNGQGEPNVPAECQAKGYCDIPVPDYPTEAANKVVAENGLVSPDIIDVTNLFRRVQNPSEVDVCEYRDRTIIPQLAQNKIGNWQYVVNTMNYQQRYRVQICANPNSQCSKVTQVPVGYSASCQQRFITVVAVTVNGSGVKSDTEVKIPSNCYCQVKQD